jgi:PD-(D/E)XK nuclease superfamily protein
MCAAHGGRVFYLGVHFRCEGVGVRKDMGSKKTCKERGEWAELCFMARAADRGLNVSRPHGDSASYDVGVEQNGRFLRIQVKSTTFCRKGSFTANITGPKHARYVRGTTRPHHKPCRDGAGGGWPTQARFWLEWGSSTAEQSLPAARSRFRAVHSDSISTRPSQPVA